MTGNRVLWAAAAGAALGLATFGLQEQTTVMEAKASIKKVKDDSATVAAEAPVAPNYPPPRPDLPTFTMEEVSEHTDEDSMWFTFRGGVYDMTFFAQGHPGGAPVRI